MSELDKILPNTTEPKKQISIPFNRLVIIGAGGMVLLCCFSLLVGFGFVMGNIDGGDLSSIVAGASDIETPALADVVATSTSMPALEITLEMEQSPVGDDNEFADEDGVYSLEPLGEPEFGSIIFATEVNAKGEPLSAAQSFAEGITEIHAIFDYSHMSAVYAWKRVWYHDGQEMLSNTQDWSGDESGQFDYFLDTGEQALPPGEWTLELYVEGELLAEGQFTVEAKKVAQVPALIPTPKSTPTPVNTATPSPTPPSQRVSSGTYPLAYSKWDGGAHNLYIADTNGNNEQFILKRAAGPSWSPDMKRLFFYGEPGIDQQVREGGLGCGFGTISDGIVAIDLTASPQDICQVKTGSWFCERKTVDLQSEPSDVCTENGISVYQNLDWKMGSARWASASPDGEALGFDAKPGGDYRIYFRAMLGTSQQSHFELVGEQGSWSPDGKKMVYRSGRDNKTGLWISNRDDTGHTSVTIEGSDSFPTWSPDGRTIAFSRNVYGNVDVYIINIDGSNLTRLTDDPGHDTLPVYTPGGEIIFRSDRTGSWGIWKMKGNGAGQQEIISNAGVGPDWAYSRMAVGR